MKKKKQVFAILLVIMSILLLACSKADAIICGNCSATNPSKNQYCSNCGTAFFQNSPNKSNNTQTNEETIINAFKDDLQGHWVLKEDDYTYVVSFDFEYNNISEGFYISSAQEFQIKSLTFENHNTLVINAHYPGSDDPFDPIPAEDGTYRIFFINAEKNQISLSYNNNEPIFFEYAGKTQNDLQHFCEETNTDSSPNTGNSTSQKCKYCQANTVDGSAYCSMHKCGIPGCNNETKSYSVSRYCGIHTCMTEGCTRKAEDGSYFCWSHK